MPIVRSRHTFEDQFTQIPNAWLRDKRLSLKSKGLLAQLMTHSPGWSVSIRSLAEANGCGRDLIATAISELEEAGYLSRTQERSNDGRFSETVWTTSEPMADLPLPENPVTDNPATKNTITKEEQSKELPHPEDEGMFGTFWELYPKKMDKSAARKAWEKATRETNPLVIIGGADRLANDPNLPPRQFIPYPASWLNAGGWSNEPYAPRERSKEELADLEMEKARKAREIELERSEALREEMRKAKESATEAPDCEHGLPLWRCQPCCIRLAEEEAQRNL